MNLIHDLPQTLHNSDWFLAPIILAAALVVLIIQVLIYGVIAGLASVLIFNAIGIDHNDSKSAYRGCLLFWLVLTILIWSWFPNAIY